jgi:hypothetical protein
MFTLLLVVAPVQLGPSANVLEIFAVFIFKAKLPPALPEDGHCKDP